MAKNQVQYYTQAGRTKATTTAISGTTIFTAGADGSKILGIGISDFGTLANVSIIINDGVTDHKILNNIVASDNLDLLDLTFMPQKAGSSKYINLETGWSIKATLSGGNGTFVVYGEDY